MIFRERCKEDEYVYIAASENESDGIDVSTSLRLLKEGVFLGHL